MEVMRRIGVVLVLSLLAGGAVVAQDAGMPYSLTRASDGRTLWLSAEAATEGLAGVEPKNDGNEFEQLAWRFEYFAQEDGSCLKYGSDGRTRGPQSDHSFEDVIGKARVVLSGIVNGRDYGFHGSESGQLLRVQVERILVGQEHLGDHDEVYVFYQQGSFKVGDVDICAGLTTPPAPPDGTMILVLVDWAPMDHDRKLIAPGINTVFFETEEGLAIDRSMDQFLARSNVVRTPGALKALTARIEGLSERHR